MMKPVVAVALIATVVAVATAAADGAWRDVLDTPAAKSALAPRALLNGLARAGERVVAVGQRGHVLLSDDGGKSWQQATVPVSSDLVAVAFPTASTGWTVGHDGVVLRTADAGATWTRVLDGRTLGAVLTDYYARAGAPASPDEAARLQAGAEEAKRLAAQGAENPFLDVFFEDERNGFVVGAFGLILRTSDGGANWEPWLHRVDNPKALHLYAVRAVGADVYITGEQGLVLRLDRAAGRFRAIETPYRGTLFGVTGSSRAVVVHGLRGTVLRSVDGGRSWQTVPTGLTVGLTAGTVDAKGRIVIASQSGHVLVSSDDGASFRPARIERPLPAAAVLAGTGEAVVVAGPRGVQAQPLN